MTFRRDGLVGEGAADCEIFWDLDCDAPGPRLLVFGSDQLTFAANKKGDVWRGRWERFERMEIELAPLGAA